MDALAQHDMVGLRAVIEGHLGRRAVRAESTAAQRAARLLARSGQVALVHVRVPSAKGRKSAELLLVVRAGIDPTEIDEGTMQAAAVRLVTPADRTEETLEHIVAAVQEAAARLADIDLHTVDGEAAGKPLGRSGTHRSEPRTGSPAMAVSGSPLFMRQLGLGARGWR